MTSGTSDNEILIRRLGEVRDRSNQSIADGQTVSEAIELIDRQDDEIERLIHQVELFGAWRKRDVAQADEIRGLRIALEHIFKLKSGSQIDEIQAIVSQALSKNSTRVEANETLDSPLAEARRLIEEIVFSHAHKNDQGGYFTDPHVYNECDAEECMWCSEAKEWLQKTASSTEGKS